jgi:hypothetical protein
MQVTGQNGAHVRACQHVGKLLLLDELNRDSEVGTITWR